MDDLWKIDDFWIRFVSVFSLFCQHFRASTTQNDLRATLAPRVLSSRYYENFERGVMLLTTLALLLAPGLLHRTHTLRRNGKSVETHDYNTVHNNCFNIFSLVSA